jgi:hypothetical protein
MTAGEGVLIAHAGADAYLARFRDRFPGLPLRVCRSAASCRWHSRRMASRRR